MTLPADLRYSVRVLFNAKGFSIVAILTLALGIGANTAMFSVINAVLLRPLPFHDPGQLVALGNYNTERPVPEIARGSMSFPDFLDVRARSSTFQDVAAYTLSDTRTLTGVGEPLRARTAIVSTNLFSVLGARPALGRMFSDGEDEAHHHVAILSDNFWRTHFNSDPQVLGRTFVLNGANYQVVGVMPRGFQWPIQAETQDVWVSFSESTETDDPKDKPMTQTRGGHWIQCVGRLKDGVTVAQANADLRRIANTLSSEYPDSNTRSGIAASPQITYLVGDSRTPLLVLFIAVGLVLLIACANVANLLLARSSSRAREIAVRAALGATRMHIVRQLFTEALVLASVGGALGIALAAWSVKAVLRLYPANLPRAQQIGIDPWVLLFTAGLAILTGFLFGMLPALQVSSPNLTEDMRTGSISSTEPRRRQRLRSALIVGEITVGIVLLTGAGLLIRSLEKLSHVDLGFNPDHVLTASFDLPSARYKPDQMDTFMTELLHRVRALPGVVNASGALPLPLSDDDWTVDFDLADHPLPKAQQPAAGFHVVQLGFFETMQIPLLRGRTFDERDSRNGKPSVIVSQAFASKYLPDQDPIGKIMTIGAGDGAARARYRTREIVGVVGDIRQSDLTRTPGPTYYIPEPQLIWGAPVLVVRTTQDSTLLAKPINQILRQMDPDAPLHDVETLDDYLALALGRARFEAILLGVFAAVALLLTVIGLYGVVAYAVVQRTREIGIRMALGASRQQVLSMVLHRGLVLTLAGVTAGLACAFVLARFIQSLLYEIPPHDPATYGIVSAILGCVALAASYVPASRATKVDPMLALRCE
jgi:putative ABC transport system permease protein